jgi:hypothetical protein
MTVIGEGSQAGSRLGQTAHPGQVKSVSVGFKRAVYQLRMRFFIFYDQDVDYLFAHSDYLYI